MHSGWGRRMGKGFMSMRIELKLRVVGFVLEDMLGLLW